MKTILLLVASVGLGGLAFSARAEEEKPAAYVEAAATLMVDGKVCGTPRGKMLSGVRCTLESRLEGVEPKTWFSLDVTPTVEDGKIKYSLTITVEKANGDSSTVTAEGVTDPTVPLKYAVGKEGTPYSAEVIFTMAANRAP